MVQKSKKYFLFSISNILFFRHSHSMVISMSGCADGREQHTTVIIIAKRAGTQSHTCNTLLCKVLCNV